MQERGVRLALTRASGRFTSLTRVAAEAHQRNVVMLAAAGGVLLDDLDDAFAQRPGRAGALLQGGVDRLQVDLIVLLVHGIRNAVTEHQDAVARLELKLRG